jgi:hypothetical protein
VELILKRPFLVRSAVAERGRNVKLDDLRRATLDPPVDGSVLSVR